MPIVTNELIADTSDALKNQIIAILEERFEKKLFEGLLNLKSELLEKISSSETRLNDKISNLKIDMVGKIADSKTETIKWMFIFWIGNVVTIIGGLIGILKIAKVF